MMTAQELTRDARPVGVVFALLFGQPQSERDFERHEGIHEVCDVSGSGAAGLFGFHISGTGYPPGVPTLLPGERITTEVIDYLQELVSAGARLHGAADPSFRTVRVLVEGAGGD